MAGISEALVSFVVVSHRVFFSSGWPGGFVRHLLVLRGEVVAEASGCGEHV